MSEIARILDQMDRALYGEAWHGPNLQQLLEGVTAEKASMHSVRGAHSIWELVNHIAAWNGIVQYRLMGETVDVTKERDWPPVWDASDIEWKRTLENLRESRARLRKTVEGLRDENLHEKCAGTQDSKYVVLHGLIQHDLYHAGQIAILKKALA